jgi:hypothetical protein
MNYVHVMTVLPPKTGDPLRDLSGLSLRGAVQDRNLGHDLSLETDFAIAVSLGRAPSDRCDRSLRAR